VGLVVVLCLLCSGGLAQRPGRPTDELTVFAAVSLTKPFTEIGKRLEVAHTGLKSIYNFAGSPTLRTQIEQGARADVFVSADMAKMELARKNGTVVEEAMVLGRPGVP
jgi:molybdate transport system substrate-binding protein